MAGEYLLNSQITCYTIYDNEWAINYYRFFEFRQGEKLKHSQSYGDII